MVRSDARKEPKVPSVLVITGMYTPNHRSNRRPFFAIGVNKLNTFYGLMGAIFHHDSGNHFFGGCRPSLCEQLIHEAITASIKKIFF